MCLFEAPVFFSILKEVFLFKLLYLLVSVLVCYSKCSKTSVEKYNINYFLSKWTV